MNVDDWPRVQLIYAQGIRGGQATFETTAPSWELWNANHHNFARLVATVDEAILGWAALSAVSKREVYAGVVEVSVYVVQDAQRQGIGHALLKGLIAESEKNGLWTLQASIFPENIASLKLHTGCGFREVGRRERIAKLNGVWRDTILLERRSEQAGVV